MEKQGFEARLALTEIIYKVKKDAQMSISLILLEEANLCA
jgi:hypothetical protein